MEDAATLNPGQERVQPELEASCTRPAMSRTHETKGARS